METKTFNNRDWFIGHFPHVEKSFHVKSLLIKRKVQLGTTRPHSSPLGTRNPGKNARYLWSESVKVEGDGQTQTEIDRHPGMGRDREEDRPT